MEKPTVGQQLFSLNVGNSARGREQVLTPVTVSKVGRKYFYLGEEGYRQVKYEISTWNESSGFVANSQLYKAEQEWLDKKELHQLNSEIKDKFGAYGQIKFSLDALRKIVAIMESDQNGDDG